MVQIGMNFEVLQPVFLAELEKISKTRAQKEVQKAMAAGDLGRAEGIAKGYGKAGLKPRYIKDISLGGQEAGVDLMMGSASPTASGPTAPKTLDQSRADLQGRLKSMKARKGGLGLEGRKPSQSVRQSATGRKALLGAPAPAAATAGSPKGLLARKLYKPDSPISRGEFTAETVRQKKDITNQLRSMGPEQRAMVPRMSGPVSVGGAVGSPLQRTVSYGEYIPKMTDVRGSKVSPGAGGITGFSRSESAIQKDLAEIDRVALDPMKAKGQSIMDVKGKSPRSGNVAYNWGNIVKDQHGQTKIVDMLPGPKKGALDTPMQQSMRVYKPDGQPSMFGYAGQEPLAHKAGPITQKGVGKPGMLPGPGQSDAARKAQLAGMNDTQKLQALRKETFRPTMPINKAPTTGSRKLPRNISLKGQIPPPAAAAAAKIPSGAGGQSAASSAGTNPGPAIKPSSSLADAAKPLPPAQRAMRKPPSIMPAKKPGMVAALRRKLTGGKALPPMGKPVGGGKALPALRGGTMGGKPFSPMKSMGMAKPPVALGAKPMMGKPTMGKPMMPRRMSAPKPTGGGWGKKIFRGGLKLLSRGRL